MIHSDSKSDGKHADGQAPLSCETAIRAVVDSGIFAALRQLAGTDGGSAVQTLYVCLARRLPNIRPSHDRLASDTGFSVSTVKRAIRLLERCNLIRVHRSPGHCPRYELADLRDGDGVRDCLAAIRKSSSTKASSPVRSEPGTPSTTDPGSQCTGDLGTQVTHCEPASSDVNHEESIQVSNQDPSGLDGDEIVKGEERQTCPATSDALDALRRHGIHSGEYLIDPVHPKAVPVLVKHSDHAAMLIDLVLGGRDWKAGEGTALKVHHLRKHVDEAWREFKSQRKQESARREKHVARARELLVRFSIESHSLDSQLSKDQCNKLLIRGLQQLNESPQVIQLLRRDRQACTAIVNAEWETQQAYGQLDAMDDDSLRSLKAQVLEVNPKRTSILREADPRKSVLLRSLMVRQMKD